MPLPLTSVLVVTREVPAVSTREVVSVLISSFLDYSPYIPFARACALNSLHLARHVWDSCPEADQSAEWNKRACGDPIMDMFTSMPAAKQSDASGRWSLAVALRSDRHYNRDQFAKSSLEAAKHGNLELFQWIFEHFSGCEIPVPVAEEAARGGHKSIVKFLIEYQRARNVDEKKRNWFDTEWESEAMAAAAAAGHKELVLWMARQVYFVSTRLVLPGVCKSGDMDLLNRLLKITGNYNATPRIDYAAEGGNVAILAWIVDDQRHDEGKQWALKTAAAKGNLQVVKWLVRSEFIYLEGQAVAAAAENGHLPVIRWLVEHSDIQMKGTFDVAVKNGHLELAKYLHAKGFAKVTNKSMLAAAKTGNVELVKWLYTVFGNNVDVFKSCVAARGQPKMTAMDAAAASGHLPLLEYLHDIAVAMKAAVEASVSAAVGRKRKRTPVGKGLNGKTIPTCSNEAMRGGIAGGHLDVVRWLRTNYSLVATASAIDIAAKNGHLEMVQWLHENTEGACTTAAMDGAAGGGHLSVVKWLHTNRSEGCTTGAMDQAAKMDHLRVVRWLHENRSEGCTTRATDDAALQGHFDVLLFLRRQCREGCSGREMDIPNSNIARWGFDNEPGVFHLNY